MHRSDDELSDGVVDFFLRRFEEDGLRDTGRCMLLDAQWFAKARSDTQAVVRWSKTAHILDKDFVYVPMNEQRHWVGAILCRCAPARYRILLVDSLHGKRQSPFRAKPAGELIARVVKQTWQHRRPNEASPHVDWIVVKGVPVQPNWVDCALYMLMCFSKHNAALPALHLQRAPSWEAALRFNQAAISRMRVELRQTIEWLARNQRERVLG